MVHGRRQDQRGEGEGFALAVTGDDCSADADEAAKVLLRRRSGRFERSGRERARRRRIWPSGTAGGSGRRDWLPVCRPASVPLEILDLAFVLLGSFLRLKRAEITPFARLGIHLSRIDAILS